jgi:hypothetical protein
MQGFPSQTLVSGVSVVSLCRARSVGVSDCCEHEATKIDAATNVEILERVMGAPPYMEAVRILF